MSSLNDLVGKVGVPPSMFNGHTIEYKPTQYHRIIVRYTSILDSVRIRVLKRSTVRSLAYLDVKEYKISYKKADKELKRIINNIDDYKLKKKRKL